MQKLMQKLLIISGLTALGIASAAGVSYAGTTILTASHTINIDCTFNNPSYTNNAGTIATNPSGSLAASIAWTGTLGVTCNNGGNVQISASPLNGSGYTNAGNSAVVTARNLSTYTGEFFSVQGTSIWKNGSYFALTSVTLTPSANIPYAISLVTNPGTNGPGLPNGTYQYYFTLTATPN
jgi:hypothetical protein